MSTHHYSPPASLMDRARIALGFTTQKTSRREAKRVAQRLMASLPLGEDSKLGVPIDANRIIALRYDNKNVLDSCLQYGEYDLITLLEKSGDIHGYRTVREAFILLIQNGIGDRVTDLTNEQIRAYGCFVKAAKRVISESYNNRDDYPFEGLEMEVKDASLHALLHPEDAPLLEQIVSQGVLDKNKIKTMMDEIKQGSLLPVISEGFL